MTGKLTRRHFVQGTAAATLMSTLSGNPLRAADTVSTMKNDRLTIGLVGAGGRGMHIGGWAKKHGDIVAVADADLGNAENGAKRLNPKADVYQDYRKVLDRKDVDVVVQAAPDHWHTKINIDALRAGKDVYGEKPLTLTIDEGKQLCKVVKETKGVFQAGTMQRSGRSFQTAIELVRNGRIGNLKQIWVALPFYSTKGGPFAEEKTPEKLDWDLYLGQAPEHYYTPYRTHGIFRWWYEYAGGIITDWGNHHVDIAQWGMDCDQSGPVSVDARGLFPNKGKAEYFNTPDRFFSRMKYTNGVDVLYFSAMNAKRIYGKVESNVTTTPEELKWLFGADCPEEIPSYKRDGILFIGDKGKVFVNRGGVYGKPVEELADRPFTDSDWRVRPSTNHMANFAECVKSREVPVAPADVEHRTITACHLTNISIRLDRPLRWDPKKEEIIGDKEATAMMSRTQRKPYTIDA